MKSVIKLYFLYYHIILYNQNSADRVERKSKLYEFKCFEKEASFDFQFCATAEALLTFRSLAITITVRIRISLAARYECAEYDLPSGK